MPQQDVDLLFEVRNAFYLGNYQLCINEAQKIKTQDEEVQVIRDAFLHRSYIAQGKYSVPIGEITGTSPPELQAVKRYAEYCSNAAKRAAIVGEVEKRMESGTEQTAVGMLMAALVYMREGNYEEALRALHGARDDLECVSAVIQCFLKLDRVDLASKELKRMQESDEDATITQLATAWVNMAVGKDKLQEAFYIYQEMIDKYVSTPSLMTAQAACLIMQHKYADAEKLLQDSLEKDSNNSATLVNLISVSQHLGKPLEICNRYISQLSDDSGLPWAVDFANKQREFDRLCQNYAAAN